ncbi:DEAD/DEAH box helicase [Rhodococcus sp. SMB37]|uniref:DEAD/DEAH box helicase n=1 Tax=Rhodococcus sp. SMB37 TaxID=2512213 RepID=UPI001043D36A|nr:DEAD/DEAH box helicase [Rhodococcus sp. SMB37]
MAALGNLLNQLDTDPVRRGSQFERICQWFLTHDPIYAHELRRVWLWKDWPQRWGADAGIDLVAEDRLGRLWAIQAKAYDTAVSITKRDVDTFLTESGRSEFSFRLLIATTDLIGRTARRTLEAQEKQASVLLRGDLEVAEVDWPPSPTHLQPPRPVQSQPRPYQRDAIDKVVKSFDQHDRGQLIMACGTGKTLTALFVKETLAAERTLVLVPSLSLLAQTLREWTAHSTQAFDFLPVCSDETVAEPDAVVANTSDLGFPVTTDPVEIATFLRRRSGPRVVFATYQSSPEIAEAFQLGRVPAFDLVISDEAHRCAGRVSSSFGTVLSSESIKADRRLFMTATPRYFTGRVVRQAKEADFEVASMDDEEVFGPVFHRLGFAEAIERDLLTDYRVAVVAVDDPTYRDWAQRGRFVTTDGTEVTDARTLAGQIGLAQAMRRYGLHRTITFHSRVKRAREFAQSLPEVIAWMPEQQRPVGHLWSDYASGEMSAGQRHALLHHLGGLDRGQRGLLANARCLAEGVDVPTLDSVAFIDPRRSEVDIVQAVGRAIRLAPDKTIGTIVIPVFVDADEDPAVALDSSTFKPVWDVIKALRAHDSQLGEHLDELRRQLGRRGGQPQLPSKLHLDLPETVGADFARAFDVRLVEQTTAPWEFWFGLLEEFVKDHGHVRVPHSYIVDGYRLGTWVSKQRSQRTGGTLDIDRVHRLQELAGWTWNPKADQWEGGFRRLLEYVDLHGDARVPVSCTVEGYRLGHWVNIQRTGHAKGILEADRERRLQAVTGWTWSSRTDQWEEGFHRLLDYVDIHGDARVPASCTVDGYRLGLFVNNQRHFYAKGTLRTDRRQRLEALAGWTWSPRADQWEEGSHRLLDYVENQGDARVPASYTIDGYRLGTWVSDLRGKRIDGTLDVDRQRQLEALAGWSWDPKTDQWEEGLRRLLEYVEHHGDARVPATYKTEDDNYRLGVWVGTQRTNRAKGTLDPDRERRLQLVTGWTWDTRADQWEEGFNRLLEYVEHHGDARVPARYTTDRDSYRLGVWVNSQRANRAKGTLDPDRERRLQVVTGWIWDAQADLWEEGFRRLLDYSELHKDARVPRTFSIDGYQLSAWVGTQRASHAKGTLDADRKRRLEELPGWTWDTRADLWEEGFRRLLHYVNTHKNAGVPQSFKVDGYRLGSWVATQRTNRAKGTLDADRERRLQELPGWRWDGRIDNWEDYFRRLLDYIERHLDARVPYAYSIDGCQLGAWVATQRANHAKVTLAADRRRRLEELPGWTWGARADQWEEGFRRLLDYVNVFEDARVPQSYAIDGYRLGVWVSKQRAAYSRGTLTPDRQRRLEEVTGWLWTRSPSNRP